jgi:hypothetical protein
MKLWYSKLTKIFHHNDAEAHVEDLISKFDDYSDKRKKLAVKTGKKNTYRALTQFFISKYNSKSKNKYLTEIMY